MNQELISAARDSAPLVFPSTSQTSQKRTGKTMRIFIPVFALVALSLHCGSNIPTPVPAAKRISCLIRPFDDKTGIYQKLDYKIEQALAERLEQDFFVSRVRAMTPGFDKTIYKTNLFSAIQTPKINGKIDKLTFAKRLSTKPVVWVILGTVEKIDYHRNRGLTFTCSVRIFYLRKKSFIHRFQVSATAALERNDPNNTLVRAHQRMAQRIIAELEKAAAALNRTPQTIMRY